MGGVPGGQLGRYRTVFIGAPEFQQGDEVVLFLKSVGPSYPSIIGLSQGAFRVVADPRTGRRMVTTPIIMGKGGDAPEPIVRAFLSGLLQATTDLRVSVVNAEAIAHEKGIVVEARGGDPQGERPHEGVDPAPRRQRGSSPGGLRGRGG